MKAVTAARMRRIDRETIARYGIPARVLMENAGSACADEIVKLGRGRYRRVLVLCGSGNNGGDGLVAARHLHNRGLSVRALVVGRVLRMTAETRANLRTLRRMRVPVRVSARPAFRPLAAMLSGADVVLDALLGIGLDRDVQGPLRSVIEQVNRSGKPVVSVDVPSGMCADTGRVMGVAVKSRLTVALGAPKTGLVAAGHPAGRVVVRDISIPRALLR